MLNNVFKAIYSLRLKKTMVLIIGYQNNLKSHPCHISCPLATLGLGLLLDIVLSTTLLGLALSAHLLVVSLSSLVAGQARDGTTDGALSAVSNAGAKVMKLASGFLLLALKVLLTAGLLQGLCGLLVRDILDEITERKLTSLPTRPPMASLVEPMVWFHEP